MAKSVILYSQPSCVPCHQEEEFLAEKGVEFIVKDIRADKAALKELLDAGFQSTPVTIIDGQAVVGFDQEKLVELLGL